MSKLKEFLKAPIIQVSIAAGVSILAIATSTIWLPMRWFDPMLLTVPALIEVFYGALSRKYRGARFMKTWYWCCGILVSTALLILSRKL
jgi:hypothetical protein